MDVMVVLFGCVIELRTSDIAAVVWRVDVSVVVKSLVLAILIAQNA